MATWRQAYSYRDDRGQTATLKVWITAGTPAFAQTKGSTLAGLISAVTAAALQAATGPYDTHPPLTYGASPANDQLVPIEDKLQLVGVTEDGHGWRLSIPSPLPANFLADRETADFAQADLLALLTELTTADVNGATVGAKQGSPLRSLANNGIYGGSRRRSKAKRRFSATTKNPQLSGPGL